MRAFSVASFLCAFSAILLPAEPASVAPCKDNSISASAVRAREDVQALVQCAYEFIQEVGFEEARRSFHEDARWASPSGEIYIFVDELGETGWESRSLVFGPDPARVGQYWGPYLSFGNDLSTEQTRLARNFERGWVYYLTDWGFETKLWRPKAGYMIRINWDGIDAVVGSGVYPTDSPGTCPSEVVNATRFDADPSEEALRLFVNCAAVRLEAMGYFATPILARDPRWNSGSVYLFAVNLLTGEQIFPDAGGRPELAGSRPGADPFKGRDMVGVGATFGEAFVYYESVNPASGHKERKVTLLKRAMAGNVPILIGSGYYEAQ